MNRPMRGIGGRRSRGLLNVERVQRYIKSVSTQDIEAIKGLYDENAAVASYASFILWSTVRIFTRCCHS
jgi:hypothetical protein